MSRDEQERDPRQLFREAGGQTVRAAVEWPITPAMVREWCVKRERILRAGYPAHRLPDELETQLDRFDVNDDQDVWYRYRALLLMLEAKGKRRSSSDQERQIAARLLVAREPVPVRIGERVVAITSRSYASMVALFRHEEALRLVGEALDHMERRKAEIRGEVASGRRSWMSGWSARVHLFWMRIEVEREWQYQLRGVLANALSADGSSARPEAAPDWWHEVGEDEVRLLIGIFEAGHRRIMRMRPPTSETSDEGDENPFGWDGLLRAIEAKKRLPPMALDDEDFFRVLAAEMMGGREGDSTAEVEDLFAA